MRRFALVLLMAAAPPLKVLAQSPRLFDSDQLLPIRVSADLKPLMDQRDSTKLEPHAGKISWTGADGKPDGVVDVELSLRGHWRRQKQNCDFAPIKVDFPKGAREGTLFDDQGDLKLVTHCKNKDKEFEQYVMREYLVYQVYNLLTPVGLHARLVRATYVDTGGKLDTLTRYGFFIENEKKAAARLNATVLDVRGGTWADVDPDQAALVSAFEYMIGGTDWAVQVLHNIVLFQQKETGVVWPMAYDFDWTGIVNTKYSFPDYRLTIKSVRERLYRGICRTPEQWAPVLAKYQEKKAAIYAVYDSLPDLDPKYVKQTKEYLDDFYRVISDPRRMKQEMIDTCRRAA